MKKKNFFFFLTVKIDAAFSQNFSVTFNVGNFRSIFSHCWKIFEVFSVIFYCLKNICDIFSHFLLLKKFENVILSLFNGENCWKFSVTFYCGKFLSSLCITLFLDLSGFFFFSTREKKRAKEERNINFLFCECVTLVVVSM